MARSLAELLSFARLLNSFRNVERVVWANGTERMENDVEHSYALAMLGWYLAADTNLDASKVVAYALVHDLVEVYAGDTFFYTTDVSARESKARREAAAAARLRDEFPEFPDLHHSIEAYERREDPEARFVYALDKIQPVINIYLDAGRTWKTHNITLDMLYAMKMDKVAISSEIEHYFKEIVSLLRRESSDLFNT